MEKKVIAYIALERFKSEDSRIIVDVGDMISVHDWESLSPLHDQGKFEEMELNPIVKEASRTAESLAAHLDGVSKFDDRLSWSGTKEAYRKLKSLMALVDIGEKLFKTA